MSAWAPQYVMDIHRPETWGYVQFERAPRPFVPDPAWPARRWLATVHDAQRDFRKAHGRWSNSLGQLGVKPPGDGLVDPTIEVTSDLYEASVTRPRDAAVGERWHIRDDGRIWTSSEKAKGRQ